VPVDASVALLRWYDAHARVLPWRVGPGEAPDPYRIWLSEIMLQQTTVAAVRGYFETFTRRWPDVAALAAADESDVMAAWAGLGYYARARNLAACARKIVGEHGGRFPDTEAELLTLPGIGRYTAAAIAAIAFGRRAVVVDANVERVVARLFAVDQPLPAARPTLHALTDRITPSLRGGDFAQAMMDLGATLCTPREPACGICPLFEVCEARRIGAPATYPRKLAKSVRPRRHGNAYWLQRGEQVLLVRRPAKGLLGGMLGLPTGAWGASAEPDEGAPAAATWRNAGKVEHVFTHFALELRLFRAEASEAAADGIWWEVDRIGEAGLPTLFAKAARLCADPGGDRL
jgi:A/G-specific adenine glycosylase